MKEALDYLNALIENGAEFPDAQDETCDKFKVSHDALREEYDRQFS